MFRSNQSNIKVLVATHKKYEMPQNNIYLPIHVGKEGKEELGFIGDNTGENISKKNKNYCELTALFWAWKNLECGIIGLSHYRRYFSSNKKIEQDLNMLSTTEKFNLILEENQIMDFVKNDNDIILPKKRNYYIETVWSHYKHAHNIKDLIYTKEIISEFYPEYLDSFNKVMSQRKLYLFNMFVIKKSAFDNYCNWLFDILEKLESRINIENYSPYQARVYGFISERLFNIWIFQHNFNITELDIVTIEKENKISKYINFLKRKISIKRQEVF
ncbi:exopolysaccharide biosynthesis protein [Bacillus sp. MUM 116]|uniref:DUF4422 domain-containing protein n=1 Tax=Bacillus sp. MUM 116 TaxID=1678002 RepID=UPI0008F58D77|nr:DUF4422 domain-containing protein [Bacillus sp. MUM 116]OIK10583.1 exopolysaccharide biosynthesis protein [Bacillus sp. MUM 116]